MTKRTTLSAIMCILACILSGCATYYKESPKEYPHAKIKGEWGETFLSGANAVIFEINGMPVDTYWKGAAAARRIPVGMNSVYVSTGSGANLIAMAYIEFEAEAYVTYLVTSENRGENINFRIYEESTKKTVAEKSAKKERAPDRSSPMLIPIMIPAG